MPPSVNRGAVMAGAEETQLLPQETIERNQGLSECNVKRGIYKIQGYL
jgi:hypothetical protein